MISMEDFLGSLNRQRVEVAITLVDRALNDLLPLARVMNRVQTHGLSMQPDEEAVQAYLEFEVERDVRLSLR